MGGSSVLVALIGLVLAPVLRGAGQATGVDATLDQLVSRDALVSRGVEVRCRLGRRRPPTNRWTVLAPGRFNDGIREASLDRFRGNSAWSHS